jgi:hypothetical protein
MKKIWFLATLVTLFGLLLANTKALASSPGMVDARKTPEHTPGPQSTRRADEDPGQGNHENDEKTGQQNHDSDDRSGQGNHNKNGKHLNFMGEIATVDATSLTITLKDGSSATFILAADTIIKIPKLGHSATSADLLPGMKLNVNALQDEAGVLTARKVQVIPGKPTPVRRVGTVTDYQPGVSITILAKDGKTYTFLVTPKTKILPPGRADLLIVGARVTIIAPRDVSGGTLTAAGIVVHPADSDEKPSPSPTSTETPTEVPTP